MQQIRKLSIGSDYKNAMHYIVGQPVLDGSLVHAIIRNDRTNNYEVFIETKEKVIVCWKEILCTMPIVLEFNINF